jgi:hypothetical protein
MSIFLLPTILNNIGENCDDIHFKVSNHIPNITISHSLYNSLCQTKLQIEKNDIGWDNCKKLTNPFEFIHTVIPGHKTQVSKLTPLSRSFYKMIEISTIFNLCNKKDNDEMIVNHLISDYVNNLSNNMNDLNEVQWCLNDNYQYQHSGGVGIIGNGNPSENTSWNGKLFTIFKNKNTFSSSVFRQKHGEF